MIDTICKPTTMARGHNIIVASAALLTITLSISAVF